MVCDPAVERAVDVVLNETDLEQVLARLIRIALGRRRVLVAAYDACAREAAAGSVAHARAAERLEAALGFRTLWGEA